METGADTVDGAFSPADVDDVFVKQHPGKTRAGEAEQASILVVDDEEDLLELVRFNLVREGYAVTCVTSGVSYSTYDTARGYKPPKLGRMTRSWEFFSCICTR